jgi:hypothetical protein
MLKKLGKLLKAKEVAELLGVSESWVYANADLLGGIKLKGSLRFFENKIVEVLENALQKSKERQNPVGGGYQVPWRKDYKDIQDKVRSDRVRGQNKKIDKSEIIDKFNLFS